MYRWCAMVCHCEMPSLEREFKEGRYAGDMAKGGVRGDIAKGGIRGDMTQGQAFNGCAFLGGVG